MKTFLKFCQTFFKKNECVALLLFCILILKTVIILYNNNLYDDGWYYSSIARSFLAGKGFANPFGGVDTGPTAWIPPFLVFLILPIFKLIGDNVFGYFAILVVQMTGFSLALYFMLKALDLTKFTKNNFILFLVYTFLLFSYEIHVFRMINDLWIYVFTFSLALFALVNFINHSKGLGFLGFLAVFVPLAAPVIAPGFVCILALLLLSDLAHKYKINWLFVFPSSQKIRVIPILIIGIIFVLSTSVWGYRNYITFHKVVLTKSNGWFEFYLSNVKDNDGLLSESTVEKFHPDRNRQEYKDIIKSKGEVAWIKDYEIISHEYLKDHKLEYFKKLFNRLVNVFIFTEVDSDNPLTDIAKQLSQSDRQKLRDNNLIHDDHWVCLSLDSLTVKSELERIMPLTYKPLYLDWKITNLYEFKAKYSKRFIFTGIFIALIPFLCLLFVIIFYYKYERAFVLVISIMYFVYTLPYVLISHELRYQEPLFGLQAPLISIGLVCIIQYFSKLKRQKLTN